MRASCTSHAVYTVTRSLASRDEPVPVQEIPTRRWTKSAGSCRFIKRDGFKRVEGEPDPIQADGTARGHLYLLSLMIPAISVNLSSSFSVVCFLAPPLDSVQYDPPSVLCNHLAPILFLTFRPRALSYTPYVFSISFPGLAYITPHSCMSNNPTYET